MNLSTRFLVGLRRRSLVSHEGWERPRLVEHKERALAALRKHSIRRSRFYRRFHRGLQSAPLHQLPVLTNDLLRQHLDEIVVDPEVTLISALARIAKAPEPRFRNRYVACETTGHAELPDGFMLGRAEWVILAAARARAQKWAGNSPPVWRLLNEASRHQTQDPFAFYGRCQRDRLHVFEDLVIAEPVDEHGRPVSAGVVGASVLITVLFSRAVPLIRYQVNERFANSTTRCDCGLAFQVLEPADGLAPAQSRCL